MALPSLHPLIWLTLSAIFFAVGEYLSKSYVLSPRTSVLLLLVSMYAVGALLWIPALKQKPDLAITGTLWSVITLLFTIAIGVFIFGETISLLQKIGIALAIGALLLLSA